MSARKTAGTPPPLGGQEQSEPLLLRRHSRNRKGAGADAYIVTPFSAAALKLKIEDALAAH